MVEAGLDLERIIIEGLKMKLCIFDEYVDEEKTCEKDFDCDNCPVREGVRGAVQAIMHGGRSMNLTDLYKSETGETSRYSNRRGQIHTLRYVRWLEGKIAAQPVVQVERMDACADWTDCQESTTGCIKLCPRYKPVPADLGGSRS